MQKYTKIFFFALLAHTFNFYLFSPVSGTALDIDKDSKAKDRIVVNHFAEDKQGFKAYTYNKEDRTYINVSKVYYGDRLIKVDNQNIKCDYVHYVKVFWYKDTAPFLIKFKHYGWASWTSYRVHYKLTRDLEWQKVFFATIDENSEEGYHKLFRERMNTIISEVGEENLMNYKAYKATLKEQTAPGVKAEEQEDKKKYVLMAVVVVVFVVVAALVVFLVKFCLK